jgi:Mg2+ and Co2+ transporter CorA
LEVEKKLLRLKELLVRERELLKGFAPPEELEPLTREKLKLLKELSSLEREQLLPYGELLRELEELNRSVELLLKNALSAYEEVFEQLFPESKTTYAPGGSSSFSFFRKKA